MEPATHTINNLFLQLGLPGDDQAIENFIAQHRPLKPGVDLCNAEFWNDAQREFIREAIGDDADWAVPVDMLDTRLREVTEPKCSFN